MTINTYFCPNCSAKSDGKNCEREKGTFLESFICQNCSTTILFSGHSFIIIGLFIAVVSNMLLCCDADKIGMLFWIPLFIMGIIRFIKEHLAYQNNQKVDSNESTSKH